MKTIIILLIMLCSFSFAGELVVSGDSFAVKSAGGQAGMGWNIWSAGHVGGRFNFPEDGKYTFVISARGDKAVNVWPVMKVTFNNTTVFSCSVDAATVKEYSFEYEVKKGINSVKICFENDYYDNYTKEDRNLIIEALKVKAIGQQPLPTVLSKTEEEIEELQLNTEILKKAKVQTEKIRKGGLQIVVLGKDGQPLKGASVSVDQERHEFWFGTAISNDLFTEKEDKATRDKYLGILKNNFNSAVHENALKWYCTEPTKGKTTYELADKILAWCDANKIKMRGHCIFWEVEQVAIPWQKTLSKEELHKSVSDRAKSVAERYKGRISEYDVNNEMLHGSFFKDKLGKGIYKEMFSTVKNSDPAAVLYVNDFDIMTGSLQEEQYAEQIQELQAAGIPVGGIGIQGHFDIDGVKPDLVERALGILEKLKLPIKITEFDIDSADEELKAKGLEDLYRICFAHPQVNGILMWGFWEGAHWRPKSALYKKDFSPTKSAEVYRKLVFDEWWTKLKGKTDEKGEYFARIFFGEHNITVTTPDGKSSLTKITLLTSEKTKKITIKIG